VNLVGLPNSGKSTLFNALLNAKMAIVSPKPQTTRLRVTGILQEDNMQLILSDTPGWIEQTAYPLQQVMNLQVKIALEDADVLVWVADPHFGDPIPDRVAQMVRQSGIPTVLCYTKRDLKRAEKDPQKENSVNLPFEPVAVFHVSGTTHEGVNDLLTALKSMLPVHPPYFPEDYMSDRNMRFFLSEMIREQAMLLYGAEIPYHLFVVVETCKGVDESAPLAQIFATIYTGKESHVPILIGKGGKQLKELGTRSRKEMEQFLHQKVYLNLSVKLRKDWRSNSSFLQKSGLFQ
jgi:GTP-binding protein Era